MADWRDTMPPAWVPLAALLLIIAMSALRVMSVRRAEGVQAFNFGHAPHIQRLAERIWRVAVVGALAIALVAWLTPQSELMLGRPEWAEAPVSRLAATGMFVASTCLIFVAQLQMGASWRVGVPADGPGPLVSHGLFSWSRNPIFVGMLGALLALFLWSPHVLTAALLAGTWTLVMIQVRVEEEALQHKHGDAYVAYAARVGRWFGRRSAAA